MPVSRWQCFFSPLDNRLNLQPKQNWKKKVVLGIQWTSLCHRESNTLSEVCKTGHLLRRLNSHSPPTFTDSQRVSEQSRLEQITLWDPSHKHLSSLNWNWVPVFLFRHETGNDFTSLYQLPQHFTHTLLPSEGDRMLKAQIYKWTSYCLFYQQTNSVAILNLQCLQKLLLISHSISCTCVKLTLVKDLTVCWKVSLWPAKEI